MPENAPTRRDLIKAATTVTAVTAAPFISKVKAANDQVQYGMIGTGSRGTYLLKHLAKISTGRCMAVCDLKQTQLDLAVKTSSPISDEELRDIARLAAMEEDRPIRVRRSGELLSHGVTP